MPDSLHCTSCTPKTDLDCSFVYDFSKFTRNTTQKLSEESSLLLITNPSKMDDTHPLPDSLVIVARDVHAVEYQPSDDICVQIIRKFSFRCLFDAIQQLFSREEREEREEREDEDEDDEDDDSKKNLQLLCELIEKLSKCERVCEILLFSSDEERGCTREEVLNEISKGLVEENTSVRRACASALMEIMSYCISNTAGNGNDAMRKKESGEIFSRLIPDVLKVMLETSDEKVHAALAKAALAAAREEGNGGERRRANVRDIVLEMMMMAKHKHSSVARSRALNAIAALNSDHSVAEGEDKDKEENTRKKEIEAFEDTVRECAKNKDELLLAVSLESLGELCERDMRMATGVFRSYGLRELLFKEEEEEEEERGEDQSIRIASITCAARVCGSAVVQLTKSDGGFTKFTKGGNNSAVDEALLFETCVTKFVEKATVMSTDGWSDEAAAAADALGTFCAIALSSPSSPSSFAIVQALMLDSLEMLATRAFHKSCVASIHALANASFYPAEIVQKAKMEKFESLQARFKKLKILNGTANVVTNSSIDAENSNAAFEKQLRTSCYSASSYRGTPAEAIAKALVNTPWVRENESDVQKRIALYRLAQNLGTRAWFARDCLLSSSTEALVGSKNLVFEPTSEAMRWRMSALKAIAFGAIEARALDMIDESQYIQIKSASEMNPFLGVGGGSKVTAIPDVGTLPR